MSLGAAMRSRSESPLLSDSCGFNFGGPSEGSALFNLQNARKRTEQDALLLANRIRLLRKEDEKTRNKIRETEQKTKSILELQRRNEENRLAAEAEEQRRRAEEEELRSRLMGQRDEQQQLIRRKQQNLMLKNELASALVRADREKGSRRIQLERQEAADALAMKAERVRRAEQAASQSRARSESAKQESAKNMVQERMLREIEAKNERLRDITNLEREESMLLAKLRQSQERHKEAFLQLEDALQGNGAASSAGTAACSSSLALAPPIAARPPRPRGVPYSVSDQRSAAGSERPSSRPSLRPSSARYARHGNASLAGPIAAATKASSKPAIADKASSSCSTIGACSGQGSRKSETGSVCSSPSSSAAAGVMTPSGAMKYKTVDGAELEIPAEEDLDIAAILNA